ncbi:MAG: ParB/Srx family N-terminal domain-containing protein, partial [Candidatus Limnocylindrus sp.]
FRICNLNLQNPEPMPAKASQPVMPAKLERWSIDRLVPYERNARTHSAAQVAQIAASIQEFGFTNPILVDQDNVVIAGHGRLAAAHQLGLRDVPVVVLSHLTREQRRAYVLADNKLALNAGWDEELLKTEIGELVSAAVDVSLLGWSVEELSDLWGETFDGVEEDPEPESARPDQGIALAIVLTPPELMQWRKAKAELGYSTDKSAFWKLVTDLLEEPV